MSDLQLKAVKLVHVTEDVPEVGVEGQHTHELTGRRQDAGRDYSLRQDADASRCDLLVNACKMYIEN